MASKEPDENCNTETEQTTVQQKKRSARRVSFAEITAVHIFDRDEDEEAAPSQRRESEETGESVQSASEDESDRDGENEMPVTSAFLIPVESPSPGSAVRFATSNDDEDNYFGPVSADFIKPERSLDSAVSDENHDITMDSTAFSMHFRSLARSGSGGEFKTPTDVHHTFGERTPTQVSTPIDHGNSMVLTGSRMPLCQSSCGVSGADASDMSLVGENPHSYDYEKLSPSLDALLATGGEVVAIPRSSLNKCSNSRTPLKDGEFSSFDQNILDLKDRDTYSGSGIKLPKMVHQSGSAVQVSNAEANGYHGVSPSKQPSCSGSFNTDQSSVSKKLGNDHIRSPNQAAPFGDDKEGSLPVVEVNDQKLEFPCLNTPPNLNVEQSTGPVSAGSISSLLTKRSKIFVDVVNSTIPQLDSTPLGKESVSLHDKKSSKHAWTMLSFEKSTSRLKRLEAFPFFSTSKAGVNYSRLVTPGLSVKPRGKENSSGGVCRDVQVDPVDAPVARLEEHFSSVAGIDEEKRSASTTDSHWFRQNGKDVDTNYGQDSSVLRTSMPFQEKYAKLIGAESAFYNLACSGEISLEKDQLSTDQQAEEKLHSLGSSSSLLEITFNDNCSGMITAISNDSVSSPVQGLEREVSTSQEYQENSMNQKEHDQFSLRKFSYNFNKTKNDTYLAGVDYFEDLTRKNTVQKEDMMTGDKHFGSGASRCLQTPARADDTNAQSFSISNNNAHNQRRLTRSMKELPLKITENSVPRSAQKLHRSSDNSPITKTSGSHPMHKPLCSPSKKEPCILKDDDNVHHLVGPEDVTPMSIQLRKNYGTHDQTVLASFHENGGQGSSKKRRSEELDHRAKDSLHKVSLQPMPKRYKDEVYNEMHQTCHLVETNQTHNNGGGIALKDRADVFANFCLATNELLCPSIDKLDSQTVGKLEDILVHLQKMRNFEVLSSDLASQKAAHIGHAQNERLAGRKSLLYRIMFEKAKLQLIRIKRDKLLDRVRVLQSGLQECQILKSQYSQHCQKEIPSDSFNPEPCRADLEGQHVAASRVAMLRQELEASGREITSICKSFHTYFKMEGQPICAETMAFVKNQLNKRASCQVLQSELQLCKFESLETKNGENVMHLDHNGIIIQRIMINSKLTSSLIVSNKLNDLKISKIFPNMDAKVAFTFILSSESTLKYAGQRTIALETQRTISLLHNTLDVLEELQVAQVELRNLIQSRFHLTSAGKLDLQLCFVDFKTGARLSLSLDVSCLKCGAYPSEIVPYTVLETASGKSRAMAQPLTENMKAAVGRGGCKRIISLCHVVSEVIEASNDKN